MTNQTTKQPFRHRGSAAVELAVLLPLIMLLALGATDFCRFLYAHIAVATAARNGAQVGSTSKDDAKDESAIRTAARAEMAAVPGYSASNPTVTSSYSSSNKRLSVTVSFQFNTFVAFPGIPNSLTLRRSVHLPVVDGSSGGGDDDD